MFVKEKKYYRVYNGFSIAQHIALWSGWSRGSGTGWFCLRQALEMQAKTHASKPCERSFFTFCRMPQIASARYDFLTGTASPAASFSGRIVCLHHKKRDALVIDKGVSLNICLSSFICRQDHVWPAGLLLLWTGLWSGNGLCGFQAGLSGLGRLCA